MRRLAALALAVGLIAGPVALAPSSQAAPTTAVKALPGIDCKDSPVPEVPGRGVVGFFESAPKVIPTGDPFAADAKLSIYEIYGYAGLRWSSYDLGCGPDLARSPDAVIGTAVANWILTLPKAAVAATGSLLGAAFQPDFLGIFDPLITRVVTVMRERVFEQWGVLAIAALGFSILWYSRRQALASTAGMIGWALLVMVIVTMIGRWPVVAGHAADQAVTSTIGAVTAGLNGKAPGSASNAGTEATSGMHRSLLYQTWLGGTFGSTDSEVAIKYGPIIFDSTALTWAEAEVLKSDPDAGKAIIEAKEERFKNAAAEIAEADPDAYRYLTGQASDNRVGYAILAGLATLCAIPFLFVAGLLVIGALIIVRFGVMLFPAFATLGLFPTMRMLVTGIGGTVVAAMINALVFAIGAAVTVLGMGILLAPSVDIPPWLQIILMLLFTVVMWVILRPYRRLTQLVAPSTTPFADAVRAPTDAGRGLMRIGRRAAGAAVTAATGGAAAAVMTAQLDDTPSTEPPTRVEGTTPAPRRPVLQPATYAPLPTLLPQAIHPAEPVVEAEPVQDAPASRFEGSTPAATRSPTAQPSDQLMAELEQALTEGATR